MRLFGRQWTRAEVERRVGDLSQVGGVELTVRGDGPARGVRHLEFRCGTGLAFTVAVDRGFDLAHCEYRGASLAWLPSTRLPGPWYFEDQGGFGWLRTALGGMVNSCGMQHIGDPEPVPVPQYRYPPRATQQFGVHDRAALLPGRLCAYGARWEGDELVLEATGETVQAQAYGEHLVLTRTFRAVVGRSAVEMHDVVENRGFDPAQHMWLYHVNFGFPFVDDGSRLLVDLHHQPERFIDHTAGQDPDVGVFDRLIAPREGWTYEGYDLDVRADPDGLASAAVVNDRLGPGGTGAYLRWSASALPHLVEWRMMGQGQYVLGLEPGSNPFGRQAAAAAGELRVLAPGETAEYRLELGVLDGPAAVEEFRQGRGPRGRDAAA